MIMRKSCVVIEDPVSTLIISRQTHCNEQLRLYRALKITSNYNVTVNKNATGTNHLSYSVGVNTKNVKSLQQALENRFLNGRNSVHCPIEGRGGVQCLEIEIEKMPPILVLDIEPQPQEISVDEGHEVGEGNGMLRLTCISDIEKHLTVQNTQYVLVQVILHNGNHYRGITVLSNQNVLYDGMCCDEFKCIDRNYKFASDYDGGNYTVTFLWYRKIYDNEWLLSPDCLPVYPPFTANDGTNDERTYESRKSPEDSKGGTTEPVKKIQTPSNNKRVRKPKQRYTPPDNQTQKQQPKRKARNKAKKKQ